MQLYDANVGDLIEIPGHWPIRVTITGWLGAFGTNAYIQGWTSGDLAQVSWTAGSARGAWSGVTSISEAAEVVMVEQAGPDNPVRKQYEASLEAELARLADTMTEV